MSCSGFQLTLMRTFVSFMIMTQNQIDQAIGLTTPHNARLTILLQGWTAEFERTPSRGQRPPLIILNTDLLAASLITHQDRCYAGLPVHHSHLSVPIYLNLSDVGCRERDSHLLSQLGELEHALLVQLDPLLQDSQKNLTQHINLCRSPSNFKFGFKTNITLTSDNIISTSKPTLFFYL